MIRSLLLRVFLSSALFAQDWPEFRGPTGQGHAAERGLPLTWSETQNVKWKVAVPGRGWSSPAIQGDRIWLTTATDDGKSLRAIGLDRETGRIVHDVEVFRLSDAGKVNPKNIYFLSEDGDSAVIEPGTRFQLLATNHVDGPTLASMAVSGASIFIRSQSHLYRLGQ